MIESTRSVGRAGRQGLTVLLFAIAALPARGNSIEARSDAALHGAFGLELRLDDPAVEPPIDAYVAIAADKGLANETSVEVALTLDPSRLTVVAPTGQIGSLPFLRLGQGPAPLDARLVLALSGTPSAPWTVVAWSWDDVQGRYVLAGQAALQREGQAQVRLELRWSAPAGQVGSLRLLRDEGQGQRTVLFENSTLANSGQVVSSLQVGALAADPQRVVGRLLLDDVQVYRVDTDRPGRER